VTQERPPAEPNAQKARRRPARGDTASETRKPVDEARRRAEEIVRTSNIPLGMALQVARNQRTLNDVVMQLARDAEADRLVARHELNRALAMQVARGDVKLDDVLRKMRQQTYMIAHRDESVLHEAFQQGRPLALAVHGGRILRGKVSGVELYDVLFQVEGDAEERLPKVQIKYAYDPGQYKQLRKHLRHDARLKGPHDPILRPQDRYGCSDRRLYRYMDLGLEVTATTLEGEVLSGKVSWMSRWEFKLKLDKADTWVVVWRHALADMTESR